MPEYLHDIGHVLNNILGTGSQDSFMYKFWSAPASSFIIITAMWGWYKHNKCQYCFRLGHHIPHAHKPRCSHHKDTVQPTIDMVA